MPVANVASAEVPWEQVCTHWEGWGQVRGESLPCHLTMPLDHVTATFGKYWSEFVECESEDDGTGFPTSGAFADLRAAKYPQLEEMLVSHPSLFSALVLRGLQTEFAGYVLNSPEHVQGDKPAYFLQSLSSLEVTATGVVIEGGCCVFHKRMLNRE